MLDIITTIIAAIILTLTIVGIFFLVPILLPFVVIFYLGICIIAVISGIIFLIVEFITYLFK